MTINPDGLFDRQTVFTGLGLRQATEYVPTGGGGLGALIEREGREMVERRVVDAAQRDSVFAQELRHRPRQALEQFLDVRIPEVVSLSVVVEDGRTFGLVVPSRQALAPDDGS